MSNDKQFFKLQVKPLFYVAFCHNLKQTCCLLKFKMWRRISYSLFFLIEYHKTYFTVFVTLAEDLSSSSGAVSFCFLQTSQRLMTPRLLGTTNVSHCYTATLSQSDELIRLEHQDLLCGGLEQARHMWEVEIKNHQCVRPQIRSVSLQWFVLDNIKYTKLVGLTGPAHWIKPVCLVI